MILVMMMMMMTVVSSRSPLSLRSPNETVDSAVRHHIDDDTGEEDGEDDNTGEVVDQDDDTGEVEDQDDDTGEDDDQDDDTSEDDGESIENILKQSMFHSVVLCPKSTAKVMYSVANILEHIFSVVLCPKSVDST